MPLTGDPPRGTSQRLEPIQGFPFASLLARHFPTPVGKPSSGGNPLSRCLRGPQTLVGVAPQGSPVSFRLARSRVEDSSRGLRLTPSKNRSVPTHSKLGTIPSASSTSRLSPPHPESLGRSPPTRPLGGQTSPLPSKKNLPKGYYLYYHSLTNY